ncbi:hypothetical protein [Yoonia sp. R2-816]|uniref:hypothetical protein n=1 Tax=Yoonia sp. R2-816 TaxID=3342638 RepID=UPI00372924AE
MSIDRRVGAIGFYPPPLRQRWHGVQGGVGGLSMSAFLTLLTVPPLLRLCVRKLVAEDGIQDRLQAA